MHKLSPETVPQAFPEDLFSESSASGRWRVARTKSRREKSLAVFLYQRGISFYLPLFKRRQHSEKRVRYSLVPVFPGYVFFRPGDDERYHALTSGHIAGIIDVQDEKGLLADLRQLHRAITRDAPLYPYDFVQEGDLVEIKKGPFKGLRGHILRKAGNCRLVLNVDILSRSVAMDIDADMIWPLNRRG